MCYDEIVKIRSNNKFAQYSVVDVVAETLFCVVYN